jgi:hypothetical protein
MKKRKLKTRGISPKFFAPLIPQFEQVWSDYVAKVDDVFCGSPPTVKVSANLFIGLRLAFRLKQPKLACQWIDKPINCTFTWTDKRQGFKRLGKSLRLGSRPGSPALHSMHYAVSGKMAFSSTYEMDRLWFEALPEYLDTGPPRKED